MSRARVGQCQARLNAALDLLAKTLDEELLPAEEHLCLSTAESLVRWTAQTLGVERERSAAAASTSRPDPPAYRHSRRLRAVPKIPDQED